MSSFSQLIDTVAQAAKDGVICCEISSDRVIYCPFDDNQKHVAYKHTVNDAHFQRVQSYYKESTQ